MENEFGSIRLVAYEQMDKKEYILLSEDVDKLDLIVTENVGDGSTAFCVDTGQLYILHDGTWYEVGADE